MKTGSYIDEPILRITTSGSVSLYYHRNQQYSIYAITNSSAGIVERYSYTAYGSLTIFDGAGSQISSSSISNRITYTGREWDHAIYLLHFRARIYDVILGKFCSRDPIGFKGSIWNLYEYANAIPLVWIDPSGREPVTTQEIPYIVDIGRGSDLPLKVKIFVEDHDSKICVHVHVNRDFSDIGEDRWRRRWNDRTRNPWRMFGRTKVILTDGDFRISH